MVRTRPEFIPEYSDLGTGAYKMVVRRRRQITNQTDIEQCFKVKWFILPC